MYLPKEYIEPDLETQKQLIKEYPLGAIVTYGPNGLNANHIPFIVREVPGSPDKIQLVGHFHRENPMAADIELAAESGSEVLVVFQGYDRYVTPSWYPSKKENDGKVAPTWLYAAVHVHGKPQLIKVQDNNDGLHSILKEQSQKFEKREGKAKAWEIEETPEPYLNTLKKMIYGLVIEVTRTEGKWKMNQKMKKMDVNGTREELKKEQNPVSQKMSEDVTIFHEKYVKRVSESLAKKLAK